VCRRSAEDDQYTVLSPEADIFPRLFATIKEQPTVAKDGRISRTMPAEKT
jgi:hypothetical protein